MHVQCVLLCMGDYIGMAYIVRAMYMGPTLGSDSAAMGQRNQRVVTEIGPDVDHDAARTQPRRRENERNKLRHQCCNIQAVTVAV